MIHSLCASTAYSDLHSLILFLFVCNHFLWTYFYEVNQQSIPRSNEFRNPVWEGHFLIFLFFFFINRAGICVNLDANYNVIQYYRKFNIKLNSSSSCVHVFMPALNNNEQKCFPKTLKNSKRMIQLSRSIWTKMMLTCCCGGNKLWKKSQHDELEQMDCLSRLNSIPIYTNSSEWLLYYLASCEIKTNSCTKKRTNTSPKANVYFFKENEKKRREKMKTRGLILPI